MTDPSIFLDSSFPLPPHLPFTRGAAVAAGLTDRRLGRLYREGLLRRLLKGVYVASQVEDTLSLRARALALVVPDGSFVCDRTAAWLHGGEGMLAPNAHLEVPSIDCFRPADAGRLRNGLTASGERTVIRRDLVRVGDLVATTPLRTALDLGRLEHRIGALAGLDGMLSLGQFTSDELLLEVQRFKGQRGVVQLRALSPLADGRAESYGESALRLRWYDAGLPRPDLQISIRADGREVFRLDLGLQDLLFAAEYDGERWHTGDTAAAHDSWRRTALASVGWQIEAFRGPQVYGATETATNRLAEQYRLARTSYSQRVVRSRHAR